MTWWERFKAACYEFSMEGSFVARFYGGSLLDNFVGFVPSDQAKLDALIKEFEEERSKPRPDLAAFLRIEVALLSVLPDDALLSRYWAVEDRFQRVVPLATRTKYDASVPQRGDVKWADPAFVRLQYRALLDVIHTNYLLNLHREKSIKRLKIIIIFVLALLVLAATVFWYLQPNPFDRGITLLAVTGTIGAALSIMQRLQTAVSRDAMTEDGIYELTGLRIGWFGMVISLVSGGMFAVVLYCIVMAGVLDVALPKHTSAPVVGNVVADETPTANSDEIETGNVMGDVSTSNATDTLAPDPRLTPLVSNGDTERCKITKSSTCVRQALRFEDMPSFYKMLILAFLAGFAERLVPDILGRLSKRVAE